MQTPESGCDSATIQNNITNEEKIFLDLLVKLIWTISFSTENCNKILEYNLLNKIMVPLSNITNISDPIGKIYKNLLYFKYFILIYFIISWINFTNIMEYNRRNIKE